MHGTRSDAGAEPLGARRAQMAASGIEARGPSMTRAQLFAALRLAIAGALAVLAVSLASSAAIPALGPVIGVSLAVLVVLFEVGRLRVSLHERLDAVAASVTQVEPLLALAARLPTRRPLPPMQGYAIAPDCAVLLATLVEEERPELVVETGSGVSTLVLAYALERLGRGRVIALEHNLECAERTREDIERHGLGAYATVVHAPLAPIEVDGERFVWHDVAALEGLHDIDLVFDDGPPRSAGRMLRYASLPQFSERLRPRGLFVLDYVGDEERAILARWRKRHPEFEQEFLPTQKGNVILRRQAA
jgi:predicted O-methyltransferase YrrM